MDRETWRAGYSPRGHKESVATEQLSLSLFSLSQETNFPRMGTNSIPEAVFMCVLSLVWNVNCCWYPS